MRARRWTQRSGGERRGRRKGKPSRTASTLGQATAGETLIEREQEEPESMQVIDDSLTERDAGDVESDDRPDDETEAVESIEKRPGIDAAVRRRRSG